MSEHEKAIITFKQADGRNCVCLIQAVFEAEGHNYAELLVLEETSANDELTTQIMRVARGGNPIFEYPESDEEFAPVLREWLVARFRKHVASSLEPEQIIGVWALIDGNPRETTEFRADGTVEMLAFGGLLKMNGIWHLVNSDLVEIRWHAAPAPEAAMVIGAINEKLAKEPSAPQVRQLEQTVWWFSVTGNEMTTLLLEKGRVGYYRRVQPQTNETVRGASAT
jgi:hypothetical protein